MKNIIRITQITSMLVIFVLAITNVSCAQDERKAGPPPIPDAEKVNKMVDNLANELDLSGEQKEEVASIFNNHFDSMREKTEISKKTGERPSREVMEKQKQDFENEVKSVLTQEQQQKFDAHMKKMRNHQKSGQQGKRKPKKDQR